ncbi:MAG: CoA-binding protein [Candidatus Aenigmatarchaeota archaeon]|nr:MAG: CoA-binding protein [Candidatus Aenigmarchaeota archaeon]
MKEFLNKKNKIAIVGVSANPEKWGYKIFIKLKSLGFSVYPINPKHKSIEGNPCYPSLKDLPEKPDVVITVVPPKVTEQIVKQCAELGIKRVWMQPGSESKKATGFCKKHNIQVIYNACFVVDGLNL